MPNEDNQKTKPTAAAADPGTNEKNGEAASAVFSDNQRISLQPDLESVYYVGGHTRNAEFLASQGQDVITDTLSLKEMFRAGWDGKEFAAKEGELFLKQRDGDVSDANLKFTLHPDMPPDAPIQNTVLGININRPDEVRQINLSQGFGDGQNANLAYTQNRNGSLLYFGGTRNPLGYEDDDGNLWRITGDVQFESPNDSTGISKREVKVGVSGERPKHSNKDANDGSENKSDASENGMNYKLVVGGADRSDGFSWILDASLGINQTDKYSLGGFIETERRSCQFNLTCIIPASEANYPPEYKVNAGIERVITREDSSGKQVSKELDAYRAEVLFHALGNWRVEAGYQWKLESGTDDWKEFNVKGFLEQKQEKSGFGIYFEYKRVWWLPTSYNWNKDTPEQKPQLPATELRGLMPAVETGLASVGKQGPFKDSLLDRYHAALKDGNSAQADRLANEFAQSPEGQRMSQQGDRLLAQQQAQEQQLTQTRTLQGPVMRI